MKRKRTRSDMRASAAIVLSPASGDNTGAAQPAASLVPTPQPALKIPPILLEGDESAPAPRESEHKTPLSAPAQIEPLEFDEEELPEDYGTGRIFLTARDPHCLYAHWDLTAEEQHEFASFAPHPQLVLRVRHEDASGTIETELHVHPGSRHWFVTVDRPGQRYVTELGHYQPDGGWRCLAVSEAASTPRNGAAQEEGQFTTATFDPALAQSDLDDPLPLNLSHSTILKPIAPTILTELGGAPASSDPGGRGEIHAKTLTPIAPPPPAGLLAVLARAGAAKTGERAIGAPGTARSESLARGLEQARISAKQGRDPRKASETIWTAEQEQALIEILKPALAQPQPIASAEAAKALGAQERLLKGEAPSSVDNLENPSEQVNPSSPLGAEVPARVGFWLNVNAELVVYGATEPGAQVTVAGQPVELRPDGSFTFRFALPDGSHEVIVTAISSHGDKREARLNFQRATQRRGGVGEHPVNPALQKPPGGGGG